MNFLGRVVRFLFWLLVISWSAWLLRRLAASLLSKAGAGSGPGARTSAADGMPGTARRLVRDPVCGAHVDETLSIPFREQGELLHFCSIACRDQYVASIQKFVANG